MNTQFESYLNNFSEGGWLSAIDTLLSQIHEVDRNAVQIWFRFYPLDLYRYLQSAEDKEKAVQGFAILGKYALKDQIDTSHTFLYGHRFWKTVKAAIEAESAVFQNDNVDLAEEIKQVALMVAEKLKVDRSLVNGITAAGLMTLTQVGLDSFKAASGEVAKPKGLMAKSPDQIVKSRSEDDSQGIFGFLKTINKKYSVIYDENRSEARFPIMNEQEMTGASAMDHSQNWKKTDDRCWEGPIPVECTAASCGTCWVGVLAGQEKITAVTPRERKAMKVFGYNQGDSEKPFMRLACQSKVEGNVTITIAPWNGVFGKKVYGNVEDVELEPVTTSAKKLRETIASAVSSKS